MEDKRRYPRLDVPVEVSYHILKALSGASTKTNNISVGGICITSILSCTLNVLVELKIRLKKDAPQLIVIGEIVWIKENSENRMLNDMGIKFVALRPDQEKAIADYLYEMKGSKK
jgi:c-di-GMP-binding flagellar brake protein YcgR